MSAMQRTRAWPLSRATVRVRTAVEEDMVQDKN